MEFRKQRSEIILIEIAGKKTKEAGRITQPPRAVLGLTRDNSQQPSLQWAVALSIHCFLSMVSLLSGKRTQII